MLGQLRYGRGLDNRKLKAAGFRYGHTTREAVRRFDQHLRLRTVLKGVAEPYRYEKEVEDFLRWSPSVRNRKPGPEPAPLRRTPAGLP
jgi:UDP-glucose 4-epimerase